jgi:hypothetical protein
MEGKYFRVERIAAAGSASASLCAEDETARELAYLFASAGSGRISSPRNDFEPVDLPLGGLVAIPAASPEFVVEDLGGLDLIRIAPVWPEVKESAMLNR